MPDYIIIADESVKTGKNYCDYFGGCMLRSKDHDLFTRKLSAKKKELGLRHELHWKHIGLDDADRAKDVLRVFFEGVEQGNIRLRIMFRKNTDVPSTPKYSKWNHSKRFFVAYYLFLTVAFGLNAPDAEDANAVLQLYLDELTKNKYRKEFNHYLQAGGPDASNGPKVNIPVGNITFSRSCDRTLIQCVDLVLGAVQSYLEEKYIPIDRRASDTPKKTAAKSDLCDFIFEQIRRIEPNFVPGESTKWGNDDHFNWHTNFKQWRFVPR